MDMKSIAYKAVTATTLLISLMFVGTAVATNSSPNVNAIYGEAMRSCAVQTGEARASCEAQARTDLLAQVDRAR